MTNPDAGKPMIENSDRGITMAKPLAWSILASIVAVVWYGGGVIAGLSGSTQTVTSTLSTMQAANVQIEGRVRSLENNTAAGLARYDALKQSLDEVKEQQRETNDLLRQILQGGKK